MASTYTSNTGIELIGTGEQAGTWGTTSNRNFNMIDTALNGVVTKSLASVSTYTLTTTNGVFTPGESTNGLNKVLRFIDSPSGTVTVTIAPNSMEKLYFVSNETNQTLTFTQGSGANVDVVAGTQAIIYADGLGDGAIVREIKPIASAGSIGTASIADDAVTAAKIADDAIVTAAIADDAVVTASIADDAITAALIADDAVGAAAIADNAVGAAAINISGNGTAGQAVVSDGDGSFSYSTSATPTMQTFQSAGNFTWNRPSGCKKIKVTVVGGGGGGGGSRKGTSSFASGGGGGGGGAAIKYIDVSSTASASVTVGSGGSRGNTTPSNGSTGGTTSFGSFCSATGGEGGLGQEAATGQTITTFSGDGGVGSDGDINMRGGVGGVQAAGGSFLSGAPRLHRSTASQRDANGTAGTLGAGGAGGLTAASSANNGGNGGTGVVIVEEYY